MPVKAPERLLSVAELVILTSFHKQTVLKMMADPEIWAKPGGAKLIRGEYRLPLSFYNRWVDSCDVALAEKEAARG